jgi:hypothetical protein
LLLEQTNLQTGRKTNETRRYKYPRKESIVLEAIFLTCLLFIAVPVILLVLAVTGLVKLLAWLWVSIFYPKKGELNE